MTNSSQTTKSFSTETHRPVPSLWGMALGVLALVLIAVGLVWLVWPAGGADQEELAARRERIEKMSATERDRLERNYERFQKLSREEQAALQEIEESVELDTGLKSTLTGYERWLETLTPWERLELRNADTVAEKIQVVRFIDAERKNHLEEIKQEDQYYADLIKQNLPRQRKWEGVRLSDEELFEMMAVLDKAYGSQVKLHRNSLPGQAAYNLQLMAVALKSNLEQRPDQAREQPLPAETMQTMIETISDSDVRKLYENLDPREFARHMSWKLQMAWWNEARHHFPKRSELDEIAKTLGGRELEKFEERKKKEPHEAYFHLLLATRPATFKLDTKELDTVLDELGIRQSRWRPTWGNRFNGGRFGDRDHDGDRDHNRSRGFGGSRDRDPNGFPDDREKSRSEETPESAAKINPSPSEDDGEMPPRSKSFP